MNEKNGSNRNWLALKAKADLAGFSGIDILHATIDSFDLELNLKASDDTVVDFATKAIIVETGVTGSISMDMVGNLGQIIKVSGNISANFLNILSFSGGFAYEMYTKDISLTNTVDDITTDFFSFGMTEGQGFIGFAGGSENELGIKITSLNIAMAVFVDQADATKKYLSLKADVQYAGFVGFPAFDLNVTNLKIEANQALDQTDKDNGVVVDYSTPMDIVVSPELTVSFDFDPSMGEMLKVSGDIEINLTPLNSTVIAVPPVAFISITKSLPVSEGIVKFLAS
jgi:hypothetical protein